jgi:hypothetical protein
MPTWIFALTLLALVFEAAVIAGEVLAAYRGGVRPLMGDPGAAAGGVRSAPKFALGDARV